jgi:hypothetical protein
MRFVVTCDITESKNLFAFNSSHFDKSVFLFGASR